MPTKQREAFYHMIQKPEASKDLEKIYKRVLICKCGRKFGTDSKNEERYPTCPACIYESELVARKEKKNKTPIPEVANG